MMAKSDVNGPLTNDIYRFLRRNSSLMDKKDGKCKEIPWNFSKFVVTADLSIVEFIDPVPEYNEIAQIVEAALSNSTQVVN